MKPNPNGRRKSSKCLIIGGLFQIILILTRLSRTKILLVKGLLPYPPPYGRPERVWENKEPRVNKITCSLISTSREVTKGI